MDNQIEPIDNNAIQHNNANTVDYVNYDYPQPSKRGRGYAPTGEFDLSLIREFRARPGFYDRNSASFKDKLHTAHQWQEISNKLGFDVSLLKDRMLQLRNRYNLEKRRLEQLRDENPGQNVESPWPLFQHLHFLSEHIRPRRSYKSMQPRTSLADTGDDDDEQQPSSRQQQSEQYLQQQQQQPLNSTAVTTGNRDSLSDGGGNHSNADMSTFANGLLAVKMEEPDADDANAADEESASQSGDDTRSAHPLKLSAASTLLSMQQRQPHSRSPYSRSHHAAASSSLGALNKRALQYSASPAPLQPPSIKIRRLDTMQERTAAGVGIGVHSQSRTNIPHNTFNTSHNNDNNNTNNAGCQRKELQQQQQHTLAPARSAYNLQINRRCLTEQKYAAFGEFVSASLLELPATRALQLVEKFTSEVVRVLLDSKEKSAQVLVQPSAIQPPLTLSATQQFQQMNGSVGEAVNGV
ncbi:GATA zinc finger domain-containing protein 10 isoform X1 [Bactrocera oleae]|uniref:GATA zinc finger domain-containing protein 10 isoform X1 n=1 Tax=Bactrocera oleae TaxID=104688 RepID=UPI00387EA2EC